MGHFGVASKFHAPADDVVATSVDLGRTPEPPVRVVQGDASVEDLAAVLEREDAGLPNQAPFFNGRASARLATLPRMAFGISSWN